MTLCTHSWILWQTPELLIPSDEAVSAQAQIEKMTFELKQMDAKFEDVRAAYKLYLEAVELSRDEESSPDVCQLYQVTPHASVILSTYTSQG